MKSFWFRLKAPRTLALLLLLHPWHSAGAIPRGMVPLHEAAPIKYELAWPISAEGFNLRLNLGQATGLRSAFNYQDPQNYYAVAFGAASVSLVKVQRGVARELAEAGTVPDGTFLLKRRGTLTELYRGRKRLLKYFDGTFAGGRIGFGPENLGEVFLSRPRFQNIVPPFFDDDFMRGESDPGEWDQRSGNWNVKSLRNPLRSANAFKYVGKVKKSGQRALALTGHWFWDAYELSVSFQSNGTESVGLLVAYENDKNYLEFAWSGSGRMGAGAARLLHVVNGKKRQLFGRNYGYQTGQWYRVKVILDGDSVRVLIDGTLLGSAHLPGILGGRVGLFTETAAPTLFDDVTVRGTADTHADFNDMKLGRWEILGGDWRGHGKSCTVHARRPGLAVLGDAKWHDYSVEVLARPGPNGLYGLLLLYQDVNNYYRLVCDASARTVSLVRVTDGNEKFLDRASLQELSLGKVHRLRARVRAGVLAGAVNGKWIVDAADRTLISGRAGLYASSGQTTFSDFHVQFLAPEYKPVIARHEVFSHEVSMGNWASAEGDWHISSVVRDGATETIGWHGVDMPGDVELRMPLPEFQAKSVEGESIHVAASLMVNAASLEIDSGYRLTLSRLTNGVWLQLFRSGAKVKDIQLPRTEPKSLRVRREGSVVLGYVNGNVAIAYKDPLPLMGDRAGWAARGIQPLPGRMQVFSDQVTTDIFETAPTQWLVSRGVWQVTNRWQCDPRWSFFSGQLRETDPLVAIWSKRMIDPEQVSVELTIGQKMHREFGTYRDYARDYNLALCASGTDLSSGYSFVFGGWGNKHTAIVKGQTILAECDSPVIDVAGLHRRWYVLKAGKKGNQLSFSVDGKVVLSCNDPDPLEGHRVAVWSQHNSVMVPRVRISSPGTVRWVNPSERLELPVQSFYLVKATSN